MTATRRPNTAPIVERAAGPPVVLAMVAVLATCTLGACTRRRADATVQAAAVRELFFAREHARQLVLWTDPAERGPAFDVVGGIDAPADLATLEHALGAPVVRMTADDLAALFREHPDGWAAFYAAHPGAPGLVEIARPVWTGDSLATVAVGRACGEHCFNGWRVTWRAGAGGGRIVGATPLRVPKS